MPEAEQDLVAARRDVKLKSLQFAVVSIAGVALLWSLATPEEVWYDRIVVALKAMLDALLQACGFAPVPRASVQPLPFFSGLAVVVRCFDRMFNSYNAACRAKDRLDILREYVAYYDS